MALAYRWIGAAIFFHIHTVIRRRGKHWMPTEEAERIRRQILYAEPEDLICCAKWLEAFSRKGAVCVVAYRDALKECNGLMIRDL